MKFRLCLREFWSALQKRRCRDVRSFDVCTAPDTFEPLARGKEPVTVHGLLVETIGEWLKELLRKRTIHSGDNRIEGR